jgi:large subunit ribosomal protein L7/L12
MAVTKEQVFEFIDGMTILDMSKFIKEFEERYGVTAAAPVAIAAAPGAAAAAPAAEEKTSFDVVLASVGDKKIQVIKVVRELTGLGLKEAKDLVDGAPKPVKTGVAKEEADSIKAKLEAEGAKVEIK